MADRTRRFCFGIELKLGFVFIFAALITLSAVFPAGASESDVMTVKYNGVSENFASFDDGWYKAVGYGGGVETPVEVTLLADWKPEDAISVPEGSSVSLDLNGHTVDRGLTEFIDGGYVIYVRGNLTVSDNAAGGVITGGRCDYQGGGVLVRYGTFTLTGGTIKGNSAKTRGGGVYVDYSATFTMTGGTISGNSAGEAGGGVNIASGKFRVSGAPFIRANTAYGEENNVKLSYGTVITVLPEGLNSSASIGVNIDKVPTKRKYVPVTGECDRDYGVRITSDVDILGMEKGANNVLYITPGSAVAMVTDIEYTTRGDYYTDFAAAWNAVIKENKWGDQAAFTLMDDWTAEKSGDSTSFGTGAGFANGAILIPEGKKVCINLAGNTIDRALKEIKPYGNVIRAIGELSLREDKDENIFVGGRVTGGCANMGGGIYVYKSDIDIEGESVTGNKANFGGGVYVYESGFNMHRGCGITDNSACVGGGIYINGTNGEGKISGITVSGNEATSGAGGGIYLNGGNVEIKEDILLNLNMPLSIERNSAATYGGGIYLSSGTADIYAGDSSRANAVVTGNSALLGGGVYVGANADFGVYDKASVTGNVRGGTLSDDAYTSGAASNVYLEKGGLISADSSRKPGRIGVSTQQTPTSAQPIAVTGANEADISLLFESDIDGFTVANGADNAVFLKASDYVIAVTPAGGATAYYDSFSQGWNAAAGEKNTAGATVKLLSDWVADADSRSFGTGVGFGAGYAASTGYIRVPIGKTVTLDLNGFSVDRRLETAKLNGCVIGSFGDLTVKDTVGGAIITGGNNTGYGGGVYVSTGTFTLESGGISGNAAKYGGGVYAYGRFIATGGDITENSADYGGGVYVHDAFTASDISVTGNGAGVLGGGAYAAGEIALSGSVRVIDNFGEANASDNLYLRKGKVVTVVEPLTLGALIGVSAQGAQVADKTAVTSACDADCGAYFTSDDANFHIVNGADNAVWLVNDQNVMRVEFGDGTVNEYKNFVSGWSEAVGEKNISGVTVTLLRNWTAQNGDFGTGVAESYGSVCVPKNKTVTLDLNGMTVDRALTECRANGSVIRVEGELHVKDGVGTGKITGGNAEHGGGVCVRGSSFTMSGGTICGNRAKVQGGGVYVGDLAIFSASGCAISDNYADESGGGVYFTYSSDNKSTMYGVTVSNNGAGINGGGLCFGHSYRTSCAIYGGTISGCYARDGGGIYLYTYKTITIPTDLTLNNVTITDNKATTGGGIYKWQNVKLTINDGCISGNRAFTGAGVYVNKDKDMANEPIAATGAVMITGNVNRDKESPSNLYLPPDMKVNTAGGLRSGASIGVTVAGGTEADITSLGGTDQSAYFTSDDENYHIVNFGSGSEQTVRLAPSVISVTFKSKTVSYATFEEGWNAAVSCDSSAKSPVTVKPLGEWTVTDSTTGFGSGVGFTDGQASTGRGSILVPADKYIILNLNGKTLDRKAELNTPNGRVMEVYGHVSVNGGILTGGYASDGGGARVYAGGSMTLNKTDLRNNYAKQAGGGIYVEGTLALNGAVLSGNRAANFGGGICVGAQGTVTADNASITGNDACDKGAGAYVENGGSLSLTSSGVMDNYAAGGGSGVYVESGGILKVSGETVVTDNFKGERGVTTTIRGNVFLSGDAVIKTSENLSGNAKIGVGKFGNVALSGTIAITGATDAANARCFISDDDSFEIVFDTENCAALSNIDNVMMVWFSDAPENGVYYIDYIEGWKKALSAANGTVGNAVLLKDWTAAEDSQFTTGFYPNNANADGFKGGALYVPAGASVVLDLNGYTLDRALDKYVRTGQAIFVDGTLTVKGGVITGGNGSGGGVTVNGSGSFTLQNAVVKGNASESFGGGVYVMGGRFIANGASIIGNTAKEKGGGVYLDGSSAFTVKGNTVISGNLATEEEKKDNAALNGKIISVDGLTSAARIGVNSTGASPIDITYAQDSDISARFASDDVDYYIANARENAVRLVKNDATVSVGTQTGKLTYGDTANNAAFEVTAGGFVNTDNVEYFASWFDSADQPIPDPAGIRVVKTANDLITASLDTLAQAGDYRFMLVAVDSRNGQTARSEIAFLKIEKASLTAIGDATAELTKVYDKTTDEGSFTGKLDVAGIVGSDDVNVDAAPGDYPQTTVGENIKITLTLSLSGADAGNYALKSDTYEFGKASITPKRLTITGLTAIERVYDGGVNVALTGGEMSGVVVGDDVICEFPTVGKLGDKSAGTGKTVIVAKPSLSGADAGNYSVNDIEGVTANITKAKVTAKADDVSVTVGSAPPSVYTAKYSGFMGSDTKADAIQTEAVFHCPTANTSAVGNYPIVVMSDAAFKAGYEINYDLEYKSGTLYVAEQPVPSIETVAAPVITPGGGEFCEAQSVALKCETVGASVYYTTDGKDPTRDSAVYLEPFTVFETCVVKAMGVLEGMTDSDISVASFEIKAKTVETPVITPAGGTFAAEQSVTINCATEGAGVFYTTDATVPTAASTRYAGAFTVSKSCTVKAIGIMEGMKNSAIASEIFVIEKPVPPADNYLLLDKLTLGVGKKVKAANLLPLNHKGVVKWESDDKSVFVIVGKGKKTALKSAGKGTAKLTVTFVDGKTQTVPVTVAEKKYAATGLALKNKLRLKAGETKTLEAKVTPMSATDKTLKWFASNEAVAKVDKEGAITAVSKGKCKIYAITTAGARKVVTVTVTK